MKRESTKHSLGSMPCLEAWCSILGAICLLKLTLNLPPQPSEHLFVLSGEEGERREDPCGILFCFCVFLLKSPPPEAEGIWWEVWEAKYWEPLLGFSASHSPSHISL